ncbi:unnamed protein product [Haemonchus placei]|uniref:Uncharacterized protein n=1 Tax=Haemonchus placei TaxID=6290 RepID=A0A3P7T2Q0_HAEPC|nr:unnamed protein product [Haemonchus placei]
MKERTEQYFGEWICCSQCCYRVTIFEWAITGLFTLSQIIALPWSRISPTFSFTIESCECGKFFR